MTRLTNSSSILDAEYDNETQTLTIQFASGRRYTFTGVPPSVYEGLIDAASAGQYFHQNIKGQYGP